MISILEMVDKGKKVKFSWYRDGELWYVTETGFEFPVPVSDVGNGLFIIYMRWIRKHVDMLEKAKHETMES